MLTVNISELLKKFEKQMGFQTEIKWIMVFIFSVYHALAFYWTWFYAFPVKWQTIIFAWFMYVISGSGLSLAVHRYWSHKSFKATLPLKIYLMLCFAATGQNSIYGWVRDHRVHHKYSDTEADPHNIHRGFFFAHIGWLLMKKNRHVLEKGRQIDMSDIEKDPVAMFERRHSYILSLIFCFILPTVAGVMLWEETWQCAVAWQCCIRFLIIFHLEMSVNSVLHMYGTRPYNKNIMPRQNIFMSFMTVGEGCHNYHHTYPSDYRSAEPLDFLNVTTLFIRIFEKLGLAYDLKESGPRQTNTD